jgi:protein-disulfide isomerase
VYRFRVAVLLVFAVALSNSGCSAQAPPAKAAPLTHREDANIRLKRLIRSHFDVAPGVDISLGQRTASEFAGYDALPVTLSDSSHSTTFDFVISTDNSRLMRKMPLEDPAGTHAAPSGPNGNEIDVTSTYRFLLTKDGHKLMRMNLIDDPMDKISLAGRPSRGAQDAKVTIVVYDDFQCPFCRTNHEQLFGELMKEYADKVRIYYKDYPLFEIHPWAGHAAVDANCLAAQSNDAYWEFADYVHPHGKDISGKDRPLPEQFAALDKVAADIAERRKLDSAKLQTCMKAQDQTAIQASVKEGDELGVNATPTMFINGEKTEGAVPVEQMRAMLDRDLRDAGQTPPAHAADARPQPQNSNAAPPASKP